MIKILYIGNRIESPKSGGDQVNYRNQKLLESIQGSELSFVPVKIETIYEKLILGTTQSVKKNIVAELGNDEYTHVFISQSFLGRLNQFIKKKFPNIIIITFFHNIESSYARAYLKTTGIRALPTFINFSYGERLCCNNSDLFITLNKRDSSLLKATYNVNSSIELPTSLEDVFDIERVDLSTISSPDQLTYLFVGVSFFANVEGVKWFIDQVLPYVPGKLIVVGKGMDKVGFEPNDRVEIHGFVDDLTSFYYKSSIVVSPILSGAGMKTKTAEALMFGKAIIGTKEAFEGYEQAQDAMFECNSAKEFIECINTICDEGKIKYYNSRSRDLFTTQHSKEVALNRMKKLFEKAVVSSKS